MRFPLVLAAAAGLRAALLLWGTYQDEHSAVPYTDVDYFVFSDAAACVVDPGAANCSPARGPWGGGGLGDPYARATYRYTPLLALLLAPNSFLHAAFGKVLFAACDLLVGIMLYRLARRRGMAAKRASQVVAGVWLLNPIIANISTRGSSESVVGALVVATLFLAEEGRWDLVAVVYGAAVHLKIFPVMYGSSLLVAMYRPGELKRSLKRVVYFGVISLSTFCSLNALLYLLWGQPFIDETFLYHLRRLDHRHNFSSYFYPYYLAASPASPSHLSLFQSFARHPLAAFVPQLVLSLGLGALFGREDLAFAWFTQTFAFVTFNKVCTSQYFLWYLWLLPPALSRMHMSARRGLAVAAVWVGGQALWLSQAYRLEIAGGPQFRAVWLAGVAFLLSQAWVMQQILCSYRERTREKAA